MKILFIHYFSKDLKANNYENNLIGSFLSAFDNNPYYQYKTIHIGSEPGNISNSEQLNYHLRNENFDIAIVTEHNEIQVDIEVAKLLKKKLFICNWDSFVEKDTGYLFQNFVHYLNGFHMNDFSGAEKKYSLQDISEHSNILSFDYGIDEFLPNVYGVMCPQDTRIFHPNLNGQKDYEVIFNGNIHMNERLSYIYKLRSSDVDIKVTGGFLIPETSLDFKDYAEKHRKAKISLSFNESMHFKIQRKGRISEILASKTMCMITWPRVLTFFNKTWMKDGTHYVSFDQENCVDKIKYYLENSNERENIAEAGYNYFLEHFSPRVFWEKIFKIAGVS